VSETIDVCSVCGQPILENRYAILWGESDSHEVAAFICLKCASDPELRDLVEERGDES
jgi:superfamily II helicase